ncbi:DedA family protein [Rhodobacteraceae bacterium HTCC2150]|nr:DedA family protein [Rhodobacteraceae bacterium HTCC2150]
MLRATYDWTLRQAMHKNALWFLAIVAFVESSFFPIPPDLLMIPMIIATPKRAWLIAGIATVASVAGGIFGYFIGAVLFDTIGQPILEFYGKSGGFEAFAAEYNEWGIWAVLIGGITFLPFKVITILSGVTGFSLPLFIVSAIGARFIRFFVIAALLWWIGPAVRDFIEKRLGFVLVALLILLGAGFYLVKFL